jgi:hypothetical protein
MNLNSPQSPANLNSCISSFLPSLLQGGVKNPLKITTGDATVPNKDVPCELAVHFAFSPPGPYRIVDVSFFFFTEKTLCP